MPERRRLTPSQIKAISVEVRTDLQAALEETRELREHLDNLNRARARARAAATRMLRPARLPKLEPA